VLPQVYECALVALSSDTDAHQAPVSFHVVSQTLFDACASMGVPFLRRFLPPLADLALPTLDANDSKKASAALRFFSVLFAAVPLRAVPASVTDDEAEDAREVLEQLVGVPEQLIRRLLALLAQSEGAAARERRRRDERLGVGERRAARAARGHCRRRRDGAAAV
jgi:hypothetical protein